MLAVLRDRNFFLFWLGQQDELPSDLADLLALLPYADLYLQDEMQVAFHPTLTRV